MRQTRAVKLSHVPMFPDIRELPWQAGIVDGEGTITITRQERATRRSPAFRCCVSVTNTNPCLVAPFAQMWGGNVYHVVDTRKEKKWSDSYSWRCPDSIVVAFLSSICWFLRAKRENAEIVLEFCRTKKAYRRYHGSTRGAGRGGSAPLGQTEIEHRERLKRRVQLLTSKSKVARIGGAL